MCVEAALTLRALAEVDPTCVGGLISFGVTTLNALRENVSFEKVKLINYGMPSFLYTLRLVIYLYGYPCLDFLSRHIFRP